MLKKLIIIKCVEQKETNHEQNKIMQYEALMGFYSTLLTNLQNVIGIHSLFNAAAILAVFTEFNAAGVILDDVYNNQKDAISILILSILALVISGCCLASFLSQWEKCEFIRYKLSELEDNLNLEKVQKIISIKTSAKVTVLIFSISCLFLVFLIVCSIRQLI